MTSSELTGLIISYVYATGLLVVAELLRRRFGVGQELTRKFVHISAGMWVFGILGLFERWQIGIIPFATFIGVNWLLYRYRLVKAIDSERDSPGTVYFAAAITLLFALLWRPEGPLDRAPAAVAGVMALTWGDALAALVGVRLGRHRYRVGRSVRSWEGSAVMLLASALVITLSLWLLPGSAFAPLAPPVGLGRALPGGLAAAAAATLAEAISPHGTDNLSVPLVATGVALALA
ncbi:MAG TPA: phosphatidate cytidylyltransferase [Roseiflexaceae bacterium]|nr:phosphatidate cytidylyltransferase [Roseiflexaceae bacterium]